MEEQIGLLKSERDRAIIEEKKAVQMLADVKKQFEAQELVSLYLKSHVQYIYPTCENHLKHLSLNTKYLGGEH